jgi:hypothetical protein
VRVARAFLVTLVPRPGTSNSLSLKCAQREVQQAKRNLHIYFISRSESAIFTLYHALFVTLRIGLRDGLFGTLR